MKKFDVLGVIGIGAYGIVLKAKDKVTNEISFTFLENLKFNKADDFFSILKRALF
jgi:hypothetical protein